MKHKDILQAWFNGQPVEYKVLVKDTWSELPPINETNICPAFSDHQIYRIKPQNTFAFFHVENNYKELKPNDVTKISNWLFDYPYYKPKGPHIMLELDADKKVVSCTFNRKGELQKCHTNLAGT